VKKIVLNFWPLLPALCMFLVVSILVQGNLPFLKSLMVDSDLGMMTYCLVSVLMVVIPFASPMAILPVASALWGWPMAGALTLGAWLVASQLLFEIANRSGMPLLHRVVPGRRLEEGAQFFQDAGVFGTVLMRAILPSDIATYALVFFTDLGRWKFLAVGIAGLAVPAFAYAYIGSLSLMLQITVILLAAAAFVAFQVLRGRLSFVDLKLGAADEALVV
jgi:hypothetical protein